MDIEVSQSRCCAASTASLGELFAKVAGTVQKPLAYSNVSLIDPVTKASSRVSWRYLADGTKVSFTPPCSLVVAFSSAVHGAPLSHVYDHSDMLCTAASGTSDTWQAGVRVPNQPTRNFGKEEPNTNICW